MDAQDHELLARFQTQRDESAFHRLVDRHIGMVYAVAKRVTDNSALAEEVAQCTFAKLADKSADITCETVLAGWLYQTSHRLALTAVRADVRRRQREQTAAAMNFNEPGPRVVAEHLELAMDQLSDTDRDALVLRFFEDRNLRDVGVELGLSEDAARMRVNRALEKLRAIFGKLGITGSAAWLVATLPTSAAVTVPAGLCTTITTAVLGGTAVVAATATFATQTTATTMNLLNLKSAAAILAASAVTGTTTYFVQEYEAKRLLEDYHALQETHATLAAGQQQALGVIQLRDEQIALLKKEVADLPQLQEESVVEIARLRALVTKQAGMLGWLQSRLASLTNSPGNHVLAGGDADLAAAGQESNATGVIPLSTWGEDLTSMLGDETRKELIDLVNSTYAEKQKRHPRGNDPNFVVSTLMLPQAWDGYDVENPRFMYDFEKRRWNIVYEAHDGFESKRILHIEANGRVWDSAISMKPFEDAP